MSKINGNILYTYKKEFINKYGEDFFNEIISGVDKETRNLFTGPIISGEWYDLNLFNNFMKETVKKQSLDELINFIDYLVDKKLFFFGFMLKIYPLKSLIKKSPELWKKVYTGDMVILESSDNLVRTRIENFEVGEPHLTAIDEYLKKGINIIINKKASSQIKRIDKSTIEFFYTF